MTRKFSSSADHMVAAAAIATAVPLTLGILGNTTNSQARHFINIVASGSENDRFTLGLDASPSATGNVAAYAFHAGSGNGAESTSAIPASTWCSAIGVYAASNSRTAYLNGANKGTSTAAFTPSGLNKTIISGREADFTFGIGGDTAHAFSANRAITDIECAYLGNLGAPNIGFGNPQNIQGVNHYWHIDSTGATENDLVGTLNFTVTGTAAGSSDPNIATFWTAASLGNQSYTQGTLIGTTDLTTKFDNVHSAYTCALMQLGSTSTPTQASGGASTASTLLTVGSTTGIAAGAYVKLPGWSGPVAVLYVSGSTLLLASPQTWNNADTLTLYAVNVLTFSFGALAAGTTYGNKTPAAGDVGSYNNCFIRATCSAANMGALIADSPLYNITIASSGAAPSFTAGPTLTSANADGYTYGATSNQVATWYLGVYKKGSATPTNAQIKAGTGVGALGVFTQAVGAGVAASLSATALTFPFHDTYQLLNNGSGDSAVVPNLAVFKAPPSGKQYQALTIPTISAITQANPAKVTAAAHGLATGNWAELFGIGGMVQLNGHFGTVTVIDANNFTVDGVDSTGFGAYTAGGNATWGQSPCPGASTVVATGDVLVCDATDGQGNAVSTTPQGVLQVTTASNLRQSVNLDIYSVSLGNFIGAVTNYINDSAPIPPGQGTPLPALFFPLNQNTSQPVGPLATDPQGDVLTVTALTALPTGLAIVGQNVQGTPTVQGITAVTFQWTNASGEFAQAVVNVVTGKILVPNGGSSPTGLTQPAADALAKQNYFGSSFGSGSDPNPNGPAPDGTVIGQSPLAGTYADPGTTIAFTLSNGQSPSAPPPPPAATVLKTPALQVLEGLPGLQLPPFVPGNDEVVIDDVLTLGATDLAGSTYRFGHVPSNAVIMDVVVVNDTNPAGSAYRCGLLLPTSQGGGPPVAGADSLFFRSLSMDSPRVVAQGVYQSASATGSPAVAARYLPVWQLLGLAQDPQVIYDLAVTATVPGSAGGLFGVRLRYKRGPGWLHATD